MSIIINLIKEEPKLKPKFQVGDRVRSNKGLDISFEVVKVERGYGVFSGTFKYWSEHSFMWENNIELVEEEKPQLTFGDVVPDGSFIDIDGSLCIKVRHNAIGDMKANTLRIYSGGVTFYVSYQDSDPITRLCNIEITEVRK